MATDVTSRPFAGNWEPNLRRVIRHTPDAIVFINGDTGIPGCAECGGRVDIQPFITGVSCEPSTNPIATATINLSIPKYRSSGLFSDGKFALKPGLEVHIYLRGYFPAQNLVSTSATSATDTAGSSGTDAMYPYYLVFHGVVTNSAYSYNGGEYTATLSCADLLHFWQYQRLVEQGAILARVPSGSKVNSYISGHQFSEMSPYSIIYTLYRDVFGAAGGIETNWLGANETNASAVSTQTGESIFSLTILFWQKRFSQTVANLRMFGANGTVYSATQAAFLASLTSEQAGNLAKQYAAAEAQGAEKDPNEPYSRLARAVGYDPFSVYATGGGSSTTEDALGLNTAAIQAYAADLARLAKFNMLETSYLTKLEIANAVLKETGFELYQDVDGDIVFKPPFYNMDTSGLRVYRIEPEDVISFDVQEKEPEVTTVKWTGSVFSNFKGTGLEGDYGKRAEFIDYRLVAQFGWRQETFDTAYYNNERTAYYAAISKMDIYNIAVKSGSVSIPIRPELRPGYPVYIVHLDCFFYVTGISHSFSFGGSCTSTLTLVGKRAKFHAPGIPPADGRSPTVSDIRLDNMHLPPLPLTLPAGAVSTTSSDYFTGDPEEPIQSTGFTDAYRKTQGFPNVVMALDPSLVNPLQFARAFDLETLETEQGIRNLIKAVIMGGTGVLQRSNSDTSTTDEKTKSFDGPWQIQVDNQTWVPLPSVSQLVAAAKRVRESGASFDATTQSYLGLGGDTADSDRVDSQKVVTAAFTDLSSAVDTASSLFGILVTAARRAYERKFPGSGSLASSLELVSDYKSSFAPGKTLPGYYRYYSSAHPDPANQGMLRLEVDKDGRLLEPGGLFTMRGRATQFSRDGTSLVEGDVTAGIPIAAGKTSVVRATHEIRSFDIARLETLVSKGRVVQRGDTVQSFPKKDLSEALVGYFVQQILDADDFGPSKSVADYDALFKTERDRIAAILKAPDKVPPPPDIPETVAVEVPTSGMVSVSVLETATGKAPLKSGFLPERTLTVNGVTKTRPHEGLDLGASRGVHVLAAAPGTVSVAVGNHVEGDGDPGYGNIIYIDHDGGYQTRYGHLLAVSVSKGQPILRAGEVIGLVGSTGRSTGPHLHYELRLNGKAVNPLMYQASGTSFAPITGAVAAPAPAVATTSGSGAATAASTDGNGTVSASTFNTDYSSYLAGVGFPAGWSTVVDLPGNDTASKAYALATAMADAIAGPAADALQYASSGADVPTKNASAYSSAWTEMFPPDSVVIPVVRDRQGKVVKNDGNVVYHAPVFPVSDERGYEVVGTYPYGRGFNLSDQTFGQLNGPAGNLPNYDEVDRFIKGLLSTDGTTASVAKVLGESKLDATTKADIAASMDPALLSDPSIAEVLSDVIPGKTGAGANTPASSAKGIGVFNPVNVAYGLADMAFGGDNSCNCLSKQADIQLLRDPQLSTSYVVVEGDEEAYAAYIRDVADAKTDAWAAAQSGYRGNTVAASGPTGVGNAFNQAVDAAVSSVNAAKAGLDLARRST